MLPSLPIRSDRYQYGGLLDVGQGFLIFGPKPRDHGFLDVFDRFLLVLTPRNTARKCRTLHDNPAVFRLFECHVKDYGTPLLWLTAMPFARHLRNAFVVEKRRCSVGGDKDSNAGPQNESFGMIDLKAKSARQFHRRGLNGALF